MSHWGFGYDRIGIDRERKEQAAVRINSRSVGQPTINVAMEESPPKGARARLGDR